MALGPLPNVQNVARVRLNGTNQGTPWVSLFFWHYLGSQPDSAALSTLCQGFVNLWGAHLADAFPATVQVNNAEAWDLATRTGATASGGVAIPGTRVGSPLPTSVAAVIGWKVAYRWRGGHPRSYFPAGVQNDVLNGHLWTDAAVANYQTGANDFLTGVNALTMGGAGGYLTCVRYVTTPSPGAPPEYLNPPLDLRINNAIVDKRLDTQRRRLGPDL